MATKTKDFSIESKLKSILDIQKLDSKLDNIQTLKGELPLEVQDLEDELEGLHTRIKHQKDEIEKIEAFIVT